MSAKLSLALLASTALVPATALAQELPQGGQVQAGQASIATPAAGQMRIDQHSSRAIIDWQSFSIGAGGRVDIVQPDATAALLNRVTGTATSEIAGQLNANGRVFLVNPNGILITATGSVNAAAFTASTLDIADKDFMAGSDDLTVVAPRLAQPLRYTRHGFAGALSGKGGGLVVAAIRAAGEHQALDLGGDGFLQVAVPAAGVTVAGRISAGEIVLTAGSARQAARGVVNVAGVLDASSLSAHGGSITLTGAQVNLVGATLDASGAHGGGTIRVGGDRQGTGTLAHATTTSIDAASVLRADATGTGDGGQVVVWSDAATSFAGTISARGAGGGSGGDAEVSGKAQLAFTGTADLTGARFGTLLLDPYNVTISSGADSNQSGFTATGNDSVINASTLTTALGTANVTVSTGTSGSQAGTITLAAGSPLTWNSGATLTLKAIGAVTLNSAISAAAGGLTINAGTAANSTATADISVARFTLAAGNWVQNTATLPAFATADFRIAGGSFLRAAGGAGTSGNPYLLTDIYGLQGMGSSATYLDAAYRLAGDVDASGTATWNDGAGFVPVGNLFTNFTGSLNGGDHVVTGLTILRPTTNYVGLIGILGFQDSLSNIGLVGGSVSGHDKVGDLVGYNNGGSISQVYATGSVSGHDFVGGLVGFVQGSISEAYATGSVSGNSTVGGLAGSNTGDLSDVYATGNVLGNDIVGGLAGENDTGHITQAYASGHVSGTSNLGGVTGKNAGALRSVYWDMQTTGQTSAVGAGSATGTTGLTTAQARTASAYTGFDFNTVWYQSADMRPILRSEAATAVNGVISVSNLHQLQLMGANLSGSYRLTGDIDASATASTAASSGIWGAGGFVPVGTSAARFTGSLDGAGHVVTGLTIARPGTNDVGLIGYFSGGSISGIGLVGGSFSGGAFVGPLVGYLDNGSVSQAYATGNVSGDSDVGGLVGLNNDSVSQAYATGNVSGNAGVGGLVGDNEGSISQSHASGTVLGSSSGAGGLAGGNYGNISQSYATGNVSGFYYVGGLVGASVLGGISQSYASGKVSGSSYVGGVAGNNILGTLVSVFWDKDTTNQSSAVGDGVATGATGLTTAQARSASAYTGFNFNTVWYQAGDMRPILRSEAATAVNGVIAVSNLHQLQLMGANLAGNYRLTGDIDAGATASTAASSGIWGAGGFVPVGISSLTIGDFTGNLDGAGHVVAGLTIARPTTDRVGLVSSLAGGSISGIGLVGGSVSGRDIVGQLVGYISFGSVSQAYATGNVSGRLNVGGLDGFNNGGSISQAYATGSVLANSGAGGLVGHNNGGSISQTYATGSVSSSDTAGGLVGFNSNGISVGSISQSYATGNVSGSGSYLGGVLGDNVGGMLTSVYWDTQTTGRMNAVGGVSGTINGATGLTTAQMQDLGSFRTTYAGFDFDTVWAPPNQAGQGGQVAAYYPQLYALSTVVAVTPGSASRAYGDADPALLPASYAGVRAGDFVTTLAGVATAATASANVGSYAIAGSGAAVTSTAGRTYRILYVPGTLTVTQRAVTVTADTLSRIYGDANPALTFTTSSLGAGTAISGALATTATASSNVGSYAITQGTITAAANPNYTLTYVGANLSVGQRAVTVTADALSRIYGDANPAFTYTTSSLGAGSAISGALATMATSSSNVGSYAITQGTITAAANPNYALTYVGANLSVGQRAVTVTADALSRIYGDANPALTYTTSSLGAGTAISGALATTATPSSNVGSYAITQGTITAAANPNYALTYVGANLAVTPRAVIVTADALSRIYGDANPALTYTTGGMGLVNGDTLSGALSTGATLASGVGSYAIGQGSLAASGNYVLSYVGATLSVTPRALTVIADPLSRLYGDATAARGSASAALVNGDTITSVALSSPATAASTVGTYALGTSDAQGSGLANYTISYAVRADGLSVLARPVTVTADALARIYGNANPALTYTTTALGAGAALTGSLTTAATTASAVGSYAIGQGTLGTANNPNYVLTYVGANLTVTPRALIVTPDATGRVYGDANPARGTATADALVNGDTVTSVALVTPATLVSGVGSYALGATDAQGSGLGNYAISYAARASGFTVTPRPIVIAADPRSRVYGDANPALSYTLGGRGLVNGDTLTGALATPATAASGIGGYAIAQGTLAASANYAVTYTGATLTVTPRPLTITADALSRSFGLANPALTYTLSGRGLVNGDTLTGTLATPATFSSLPGGYSVLQGSLAASANYTVTYVPGSLTVTRPLVLAAGLIGSTQERDAFATDTTPRLGRSVAADDGDLPASTTLAPTVCPREQACPARNAEGTR